MVIARLSLGLSFLGLRNFLKLCHDEKPCTWWLGEKGLGSLQSRLARMLHHEYDALKGYRFLGGAISFYSVSCMSDVIFNPSLLNWSSLILTVAHVFFGNISKHGCMIMEKHETKTFLTTDQKQQQNTHFFWICPRPPHLEMKQEFKAFSFLACWSLAIISSINPLNHWSRRNFWRLSGGWLGIGRLLVTSDDLVTSTALALQVLAF